MRGQRIRLIVSLFVLGLVATSVGAHPHVFIDSRMRAEIHGDTVTHISAHWTFDRFFTHQVMRDFNLDPSGDFSSDDVEAVRRGAFDNLRNYDYFIFIEVDGREISANNPENFNVELNADDRLVYTFDIPVDVELTGASRKIEVAMYDEEFFVDMAFADDYIEITGTGSVEYEHDIEQNVYDTGIWGPMVRERVVLNLRRRMQ